MSNLNFFFLKHNQNITIKSANNIDLSIYIYCFPKYLPIWKYTGRSNVTRHCFWCENLLEVTWTKLTKMKQQPRNLKMLQSKTVIGLLPDTTLIQITRGTYKLFRQAAGGCGCWLNGTMMGTGARTLSSYAHFCTALASDTGGPTGGRLRPTPLSKATL